MSFSIRLINEERANAENVANLYTLSLGESFKRALFEQIEDDTILQLLMKTIKNILNLEKITPHF